jgi:hypothetical protein
MLQEKKTRHQNSGKMIMRFQNRTPASCSLERRDYRHCGSKKRCQRGRSNLSSYETHALPSKIRPHKAKYLTNLSRKNIQGRVTNHQDTRSAGGFCNLLKSSQGSLWRQFVTNLPHYSMHEHQTRARSGK